MGAFGLWHAREQRTWNARERKQWKPQHERHEPTHQSELIYYTSRHVDTLSNRKHDAKQPSRYEQSKSK